MAASRVDKKYLGHFAENFQCSHSHLAQSLFQLLGILTMLWRRIKSTSNIPEHDIVWTESTMELYTSIIWLAREGLEILEKQIIPMVSKHGAVKVLSYKLRASFNHMYTLYYIDPIVWESRRSTSRRYGNSLGSTPQTSYFQSINSNRRGRETSSESTFIDMWSNILIPARDYRLVTRRCFEEAAALAKFHLYGNHPLRLSLMVEYSSFVNGYLNDGKESRRLARMAIAEALYEDEKLENREFRHSLKFIYLLERLAQKKHI